MELLQRTDWFDFSGLEISVLREEGKRLEQERIPKPGQIYRHFKNRLYQIITVATHWETGEKMVVYQALYGDFKTYVRPLDMFVSELDLKKYPDAGQKYQFEQVIIREDGGSGQVKQEGTAVQVKKINDTIAEAEGKLFSQGKDLEPDITANEEGSVNPVLLEFLEADTYEEKLDILLNKKKYLSDNILNDMAVSIDCALDEGDLEERISEFAFCLQTHARFENNRLR